MNSDTTKRENIIHIYSKALVLSENVFCLLLSQQEFGKIKPKTIIGYLNIQIPVVKKQVYVIPRIYVDHAKNFHEDSLSWQFDINDKRRIKRVIKDKK